MTEHARGLYVAGGPHDVYNISKYRNALAAGFSDFGSGDQQADRRTTKSDLDARVSGGGGRCRLGYDGTFFDWLLIVSVCAENPLTSFGFRLGRWGT